MSRIILFGENGSIAIFEETAPAEILKRRIQHGYWQPPEIRNSGTFRVEQKGDTLLVLPALSKRETQYAEMVTSTDSRILLGIAAGYSDEQIGSNLGISPRTVRFHVDRLKKRLDAVNREHLIAKASMLGLCDFSQIMDFSVG